MGVAPGGDSHPSGGRIPPIQYFILTTVVVGVSALILLVLSRLIAKMMHGVD